MITERPAFNAAIEIPVPIVPPPITPTFLMSFDLAVLSSGILLTALSEKKVWINPSL